MAVCRGFSLPTSVLLFAPGCFLRSNAGMRDRHPGARSRSCRTTALVVARASPATSHATEADLWMTGRTMQRSGQQDSGEGIQMPGPGAQRCWHLTHTGLAAPGLNPTHLGGACRRSGIFVRVIASGAPAVLFQQAQAADGHAAVGGFAHVVDSQQGHAGGGQVLRPSRVFTARSSCGRCTVTT